MGCSEFFRVRVSPEIRLQAKALAERESLNESAWLRRLVIREIHAAAESSGRPLGTGHGNGIPRKAGHESTGSNRPILVRLQAEDRILLDARAEARGLRPATYLSVLARAHLRALVPLPKEEFLALTRSIAELASIGRNINQIAKAVNEGARLPGSVREEFRAMLKICEALRGSTKSLIKANVTSWKTGHDQAHL